MPGFHPCEFILRDGATGRWLRFAEPREIVAAETHGDVPAALARVERAVSEGAWVAGWIAYEAAPAFDPALTVRADDGFPCLVFGIFDRPSVEDAPLPIDPSDAADLPRVRAGVTRSGFDAAMHRIREAIREGDTYQVNYTYRLRGRLRSDPWGLFQQLVAAQSATYAAWARVGPWAVASASPELLVRRDGSRLVSRPMKGTAPRGGRDDADRAHALLASRKDRAENLMIVDMVRNDLSAVAEPGSVRVPELFTLEAYPTVWQLTSTVEAASHAPLGRVLGALFPAASITGAPKASTMGLIAELEASPRRIYCGSLGFAAPDGRIQFNVAIRTALVDTRTGQMEYGVGGGIVWDSDPAREWEEARTKARILHHEPPRFDLLETLKWHPAEGFVLLEEHLDRLNRSAVGLGFRLDLSAIRTALHGAATSLDVVSRVRLTLDRSGVASVESAPLVPAPPFDRPRLAIPPACIASADPFLRYKTTFRELYDGMRALCPDADDVLLWNERGEVTETTWSNLFVEHDGTLWTPPVTSGLLPGTLRAHLIAEGRARERVLTPDDVLDARRVWLGNSVRGLYEAGDVVDLRTGRVREV